MYPDLNLPAASLKLVKEQDQVFVFDIIRKKNIVLTPEEWVRQHFIHFLVEHRAFPRSLFRVETGLQYDRLNKRSDIQVYNREGRIFMLVECKACTVPLNEQVLKQAAVYNKTLDAEWLVITNGLLHYAFQKVGTGDAVRYEKRAEIPTYSGTSPG
jgi:hypothetical protein